MKRSTLRNLIFITGLVTALSHLYLNVVIGEFSPLFTLNAVGYLGLLAVFFLNLAFLRERKNLVTLAFAAYAVLTIIAWIPSGGRDFQGYATKVDELVLVIALILHYRLPEEPEAS
ncbi:MAG: hypothetical protein IIC78_03290 [Chloroflexi bacterium]|nr:hypothetical protein [Chloroflexota bacterium]